MDGSDRGEIMGPPKLLGFILWKAWISEQTVEK